MKFPGFVGPSYTLRSLAFDNQRSMNVYPESDESGAGKSPKALIGRPGLSAFLTLAQVPVRGLFAGGNRLFAVGGSHLYELTSGSAVDRSALSGATTIGNDGNPVYAAFNGNQLILASAGDLYCDEGSGPVAIGFTVGVEAGSPVSPGSPGACSGSSTTSLTIALGTQTLTLQASLVFTTGGRVRVMSHADPTNYMVGTVTSYNSTTGVLVADVLQLEGSGTIASWDVISSVPAVQCGYMDDYFMVLNSYSTNTWNISSLLDGTTWDPLDYASKEGYPDHTAALLADHEEVWLWGAEGSTEVWVDTGAAPPAFPFQRNNAAFIHYGCAASNSPVRLNDGVAWLAFDAANPSSRGGPIAVYAQGFQPKRVSTHAVEQAWAAYTTYSDAVSYVYLQDGHQFWEIHFPTGDATWVYDSTEGAWHERGYGANGATWDRERGWCHAYVDLLLGTGPQHYVGDWQNGKVYLMSPIYTADNGTAIAWQRTAPYISDEEKPIASHRFQVDGGPGISCSLLFSDNYGVTWSNPKYPRAARVELKAGYRYTFSRLGAGPHRLYRLNGFGGGNLMALTGAYLRASEAADA